MTTWRDEVFQVLAAPGPPLILAADPDALLVDETMLQKLHATGYALLPFDDPVAFRAVYEAQYRPRLTAIAAENSQPPLRPQSPYAAIRPQSEALFMPLSGPLPEALPIWRLVVTVNAEPQALARLPYDLLQVGRRASLGLTSLFPALSYPVLRELDRADIDALDVAYRAQPHPLAGSEGQTATGDNGTRDFLLRYVFGIDSAAVATVEDLLAVLLRLHNLRRRLPPSLATRLIDSLQQQGRFAGWPLAQLIQDREAFLTFLAERWPPFLDRLARSQGAEIHESPEPFLTVKGPLVLPFDAAGVRPFIDSLFLDGVLQPVSHRFAGPARRAQPWVVVGIKVDQAADRHRRLAHLLDALGVAIPGEAARYQDWLQFAPRWAELSLLWHAEQPVAALVEPHTAVQQQVDAAFLAWLIARYAGLHNQPIAAGPVLVHHIPRYLSLQLQASTRGKIALLVLDGMALDQWLIIRGALSRQRPAITLSDAVAFAWIPTITPVSRQAMFTGKLPSGSAQSINSTAHDEAGWRRFWTDTGLGPDAMYYMRGIRDARARDLLATRLAQPKLKVVGLVIDSVDDIAHGMKLGTAGMHNQVRQWVEEGFLAGVLDLLHSHGFSVYLTADHGNVEAVGMGRPLEGAMADTRGERVRVYPDEALRDRVQAQFSHTIPWPTIGLPGDYVPLLAGGRAAFVPPGERIVAHGGCTLEEVMVPFVTIEHGTA